MSYTLTGFCRTPDGFDSHAWIGSLTQGRHIAMGKNWVVTTFGRVDGGVGGCECLNVRVPDLRAIDYILNIQFTMNPLSCGQPVYEAVNKKITGNVVGMTIFGLAFATGTTLMAEVIAVGH